MRQIKKQLQSLPVGLSYKGKTDFGICDLDMFEITIKVNVLKATLLERFKSKKPVYDLDAGFSLFKNKLGI